MTRPRLLFVSPRFLLPIDSGGKIRTTEILRHLKGGHFDVTLLSPSRNGEHLRFQPELEQLADRCHCWPITMSSTRRRIHRLASVLGALPISVASDRSLAGQRLIARELAAEPDVVVFDFVHSAVLAPSRLRSTSVLFTHNVESEIYARHASVASGPLMRAVWRSQTRKMARFESQQLPRFDRVVAVSTRDAAGFSTQYGIRDASTIPTGVDLDYFAFHEPPNVGQATPPTVAFTGAMDGPANVDGIEWLMASIWPRVVAALPGVRMKVVGRAPPAALVRRVRQRMPDWIMTGRVDDVRTHLAGAAAFVMPLRVGGGTRIKAFEAMASGVPVVSTSVGIEGLDVTPDEHYLLADDAERFAAALVRLLTEPGLGTALAGRARAHLERHYSNRAVARAFEQICVDALERCSHGERRAVTTRYTSEL